MGEDLCGCVTAVGLAVAEEEGLRGLGRVVRVRRDEGWAEKVVSGMVRNCLQIVLLEYLNSAMLN